MRMHGHAQVMFQWHVQLLCALQQGTMRKQVNWLGPHATCPLRQARMSETHLSGTKPAGSSPAHRWTGSAGACPVQPAADVPCRVLQLSLLVALQDAVRHPCLPAVTGGFGARVSSNTRPFCPPAVQGLWARPLSAAPRKPGPSLWPLLRIALVLLGPSTPVTGRVWE